MNSEVKEIITDIEVLGDWSDTIDPRKEGNLCQEIVLSLKKTMRDKNLTSLTAPQIGYKKRVFCIRFGDDDIRTFINPMIENNSNLHMSREKCSSIPDKEFIRPRFGKIKVYYTTPMSKIQSTIIAGRSADVFQHCMDHLDGTLLCDIGLEIDNLWDEATDEERDEVLKAYLDALDIRQKQLTEEIESDEELKQINDAVKFIGSVGSGETKIDNSLDVNSSNGDELDGATECN